MKTTQLNVAIVGAGVTGLTAARELTSQGHKVTVFERAPVPGGLGTYLKVGKTSIERYYHHFFQSDKVVINLIHELGIGDKLKFYPSRTSVFDGSSVYPFSGPVDLMKFSPLSFIDRIRCGLMIAYLKFSPFNTNLDKISAASWIKKAGGDNVYKAVWEPLLVGKFAQYAKKIPAMWLQGRVKDRTLKLGYLDGGAETLFDALIADLKKNGAVVHLNTGVSSIKKTGKKVVVTSDKGSQQFDACVVTAVSPIASKLIKNKLDPMEKKNLESQDQLGAVCVLLELKKSVQKQYWINVCDLSQPVLVMIEQTNLIDKSNYANRTLFYLANYIHRDDKRFALSDADVVKTYTSILKKINPEFNSSWIYKAHVSRVPRAQTLFATGSLKNRPPMKLSVPGLYLANIDMMYPHDRNFNLAAELGKKVSALVMEDLG